MRAKFVVLFIFFNINSWATPLYINASEVYPSSCKDLNQDQLIRNIIQIQVSPNKNPFYVKCNQEVEGGGWTIVLNRYDGSRYFNCKWEDCKKGFGSINREFFIGLEKLHEMTSSTLHEVLIIMEDFESQIRFARYNAFAIDDESNSYMLSVLGNYSGDSGDSLSYQSGHKFSSIDRDVTEHCAESRQSPGWFNFCTATSNIFGNYANGAYENDENYKFWGMCWYSFRGPMYSLKKLIMMIRPLYK